MKHFVNINNANFEQLCFQKTNKSHAIVMLLYFMCQILVLQYCCPWSYVNMNSYGFHLIVIYTSLLLLLFYHSNNCYQHYLISHTLIKFRQITCLFDRFQVINVYRSNINIISRGKPKPQN